MTPDWSENADILLIWDDGRATHLGTLHFEITDKGKKIKMPSAMWFRLGWELVKTGFAIMFRKAGTKHD